MAMNKILFQVGMSLHKFLHQYGTEAWLIKHKLLQTMRLREEQRRLDGRMEINDAYWETKSRENRSGRRK